MNKAILLGRIGKTPEARYAASGTAVVNFSLATSERFKGEEQTTWHNVVAFGKTGEFIEKYFSKGDLILVEGKIQNRSYDDKDGNKRYVSEVVVNQADFVPGSQKKEGQRTAEPQTGQAPAFEEPPFNPDDDIPF